MKKQKVKYWVVISWACSVIEMTVLASRTWYSGSTLRQKTALPSLQLTVLVLILWRWLWTEEWLCLSYEYIYMCNYSKIHTDASANYTESWKATCNHFYGHNLRRKMQLLYISSKDLNQDAVPFLSLQMEPLIREMTKKITVHRNEETWLMCRDYWRICLYTIMLYNWLLGIHL